MQIFCSHLCLWGAPPADSGRGRHRKYGDKFKLNKPLTWSPVSQSIEVNHANLGWVKVRSWLILHFHKAATRTMLLIRVELSLRPKMK